MRKPFQGVLNIIRFNWHFYVYAAGGLMLLTFLATIIFGWPGAFLIAFCLLALASVAVTLLVSFYIYDLSNLYSLDWLDDFHLDNGATIVNIHAGFDETSQLLSKRFSGAKLTVFDFYDPEKHTEISIERARKAYPQFPETQKVSTGNLPLENDFADAIFVILAAHEIRNDDERISFFTELYRVLNSSGKIFVTEHLRDVSNFLAYNVGSFHFFSRSSWFEVFRSANLTVAKETKITPFISTFVLEKNGASS